MDVLEIKHPGGEIKIIVNEYFPCDMKRLKILKPLIKNYCSTAIVMDLMQTLCDLKCRTEQHQTRLANDLHRYYQKAKDLERMLKTGKHPNGVPISEDERSQIQVDLKDCTRLHKRYKKEFDAAAARIKKLQKNIEVLRA